MTGVSPQGKARLNLQIVVVLLRRLLSLLVLQNIVLVFELIGIPLGIYAIYQTNIGLSLQTEAMKRQEISDAWSRLTAVASGNSGKAGALATLIQEGEDLAGLRLDCETMGSRFADNGGHPRCERAPYIRGLYLNGKRESDVQSILRTECPKWGGIKDSTFSGSKIEDSFLYCTEAFRVDLSASVLRSVSWAKSEIRWLDLSNSLVMGDFEYDHIVALDLSNSEVFFSHFVKSKIDGADFSNAHFGLGRLDPYSALKIQVSNTEFCDTGLQLSAKSPHACMQISDLTLDAMWAWDDQPPKAEGDLAQRLKDHVTLCSASLRPAQAEEKGDVRADLRPEKKDKRYNLPNGCEWRKPPQFYESETF